MKILSKRFLAWGMTLCMICGLLPMMAFATEHQHDESCGYVAAVECNCEMPDGVHTEECSYNPGAECTYVAPQETEEPAEEPVVPAAEDEPTTEPLADEGLENQATDVTITGDISVTMQKDETFFGSNYVLTSPEGVAFTNIEWSVSGELPTGITLVVNDADGAGKSTAFFSGTPTTMTDGAISVTINAKATDGTNTYTGSLTISITVEDSPAYLKLNELIQSAACEVDMATANTQDAVVRWVQNTWLPSLSGYRELVAQLENGWTITVEAVNDQEEGIGGFTAAVAGTEADPNGTDGSLTVRFRLDENYNYLESSKTCTIKATEYSVSPDIPVTYEVTFYPNTTDGTGTMWQQTFTAGVKQALTPNAFIRPGYIFMGWDTQMDGKGTPYADEASITLNSNLTLYAQWEKLTITAEPETLTGNGTITFTTSFDVGEITCSDSRYEHYISGSGQNWSFQMKNNVTTDLTFTITYKGETASCTVSFVQDPNALILTPSRTSLTGNGVIVLTGNKEITSIKCSNDTYNEDISGSGQNWQFVMDRNVDVKLRFEATDANGETAVCWVEFKEYNSSGSSGGSSSRDDDDSESIPVISDEDETTTKVTVKERNGIYDVALEPIPDSKWDDIEDGEEIEFDFSDVIEEDAEEIVISIPGTTVKDMAEETNADLKISTPIADVNIDNDTLAENKGKLVMETERTEDGISAKVNIGGVTVIDTGVKLPVGVDLPDDGKLEVSTLQPSVNDLNFLAQTETAKPSTRVVVLSEDTMEDIIKSTDATIIGPDGGRYTQHEKLLINGKEYYVSGSGDGESLSLYDKAGNMYSYDGEKDPQVIGQDARTEYPENEFISINDAIYQIYSVLRDTNGNETLILYLDGKPAGMFQSNQYGEMDSINIYNDDYHPAKVKERQQNSKYLGTVTTDETPIDGLENGKTYDVSVIGSQDISVPGYDEAVLNSIKAETEAEKAAREKVERLKADMEAKKAAVDQLWTMVGHPDYLNAVIALEVAEAAYEAALAELAALANLQSATVTQTFDIPNELVGRTDVTFVAVHNTDPYDGGLTNPFDGLGSSLREEIADFIEEWHKQWEETYRPEIGTVEVSGDGQTLTATYTVSSFSPFTIYAFTEADEPEIKVIGSGYQDVSMTDWYYPAVKYVSEHGLMSGTDTSVFSPAEKTTRGMIVTILHRMEGKPDAGTAPFTDVKADMYYADAIAWAAANGIVSGYGDTFGPNDPITREQLASILWRYAKYKGDDVSVGEDTNILSYEDAFSISEYAIPAMQWACGAGIISGNDDGTLNPAGHAQRSHAAQMLMKFDKNVK